MLDGLLQQVLTAPFKKNIFSPETMVNLKINHNMVYCQGDAYLAACSRSSFA